jgi:hypothetical protein
LARTSPSIEFLKVATKEVWKLDTPGADEDVLHGLADVKSVIGIPYCQILVPTQQIIYSFTIVFPSTVRYFLKM